jgi:hypothetical protein
MTQYTVKNAILDLGFVDGCLQQHLQTDGAIAKYLWEALDRIGQRILMKSLSSGQMLYDPGIIRGAMWLTPMPGAYSDAMDRLMEFFTHGKVDWYELPQRFTGMEHTVRSCLTNCATESIRVTSVKVRKMQPKPQSSQVSTKSSLLIESSLQG